MLALLENLLVLLVDEATMAARTGSHSESAEEEAAKATRAAAEANDLTQGQS